MRYQECLGRPGIGTKAEVAEVFGVSRARVTQYMNLLKLPRPILDFLLANAENPEVLRLFTERRLRPLTWIEDPQECLGRFREVVKGFKGRQAT